MITTQITKYKQTYEPPRWPGTGSTYQRPDFTMNKLEFAQMLGKLPYKKGDLIAYNHYLRDGSFKGVTAHCIREVLDIIEIHHLVNYWGNSKDDGPDIIVMGDHRGDRLNYLGSAFKYSVVKPEDYPPEWKEYLANKANKQVSGPDPSGTQ